MLDNVQHHNPREALVQERLANVTVTNENAREVMELAGNIEFPLLSDAMSTLEGSIRRQAALDIAGQVATGQYSQTQIRSMLVGRMLARAQTLSFAYFMLTFHLLKTIRDDRLAPVHPAQYSQITNGEDRSFIAMAEAEAGISPHEASNIMTLGEIIIPVIRDNLGWTEQEIFERINKSNLYTMIPVFRVLVSQLNPGADDRQSSARIIQRAQDVQVRWAADELGIDLEVDNQALREMDEDEQADYLQEHEDNIERVEHWLEQQRPERRVNGTMEWLLNRAEAMPNRDFRRTINPRNEDPIDAFVARRGSMHYFVAQLTADQWELVQRVLRERLNSVEVDSLQQLWERIR